MSTQTANQQVKITKTVVDKLTRPATGQTFLRDVQLKGFGVRITSNGVRSFIVEKRMHGRVRRMTLGRVGELTVEQARKLAQVQLGKVASGVDVVAERRKERIQGVTLLEAYRDFLKARKSLKPTTLRDYNRVMNVILKDWAGKPITSITKPMVAKRHRELGEARGEYHANLVMRFLRAVLNFAKATYDDGNGHSIIPENPVAILSQTRAWFHQERRQTVIKMHQLPAWYKAVVKLRSAEGPGVALVVADYLLCLLFTGLRASEAARLTWNQVDLVDRTLTIPDPKNRQPLTLPLSDFLHELFSRRLLMGDNGYVFTGNEGEGRLIEPRRQVEHVKKDSGVSFMLHDLRRTFITSAESLDIPMYAIKRLVNHKMNGDVTAGYIVSDVDRLRGPMQKITDYLLSVVNQAQGKVIPLPVVKVLSPTVG